MSTTSPAPATQPRQLNVGIVGVNGRGGAHVHALSNIPSAKIVALCDVDALSLVQAARVVTTAKPFIDFRDMLKMPGLDAVLVSTADHTHAVISAAALRAGKHVYSEKPLCHTIAELRAIVELAKQTNLVTQTGIQEHAQENYREVAQSIQAGTIGPVREVHIWHNRKRRDFSAAQMPPPASLNYDLWLGPVEPRPFKRGFHPYSWREWWAFGDAELGDQGCHFLDIAFWSLGLKPPTRITTTGSEPVSEELVCDHLIAHYEFAARGEQPPVALHWYDYPHTPPQLSSWNLEPRLAKEAVMFIGEKGMLCTHYDRHLLLPVEKFPQPAAPPENKPANPKTKPPPKPSAHHLNWVNACLKNDPAAASAPFSYGALLTETAILGTLAFRAGKTLEWDTANMRFPNAPEAERFLSYRYRDGWTL